MANNPVQGAVKKLKQQGTDHGFLRGRDALIDYGNGAHPKIGNADFPAILIAIDRP